MAVLDPYSENDVVFYQGSSWIANANTTAGDGYGRRLGPDGPAGRDWIYRSHRHNG